MQEYKDKYRHPLWKEYESLQIKKVGHNDMDYLVLCAFADSVLNGEDSPIDVYDTALWMSITYLSEQSVAMGGMPVPVPDFTKGAWINRKPERRSKYALSRCAGRSLPEGRDYYFVWIACAFCFLYSPGVHPFISRNIFVK